MRPASFFVGCDTTSQAKALSVSTQSHAKLRSELNLRATCTNPYGLLR